ncbi:MAG TPA: hypothetical protein VHZ55_27995 [Bryobacteraceae bacterium]|jgi:hypothetical protein|nr:hypothetical protein [Bryobacteraceae bacterium]
MPSLGLSVLSLLLIVALWILFVGGTRRNEMFVGAGVLVLSAAFLFQVWRTETLRLEVRWEDVVQGWRIPWYVVSKVCEIIVILAKDLFKIKRAGSFYRVSGFTTSKSDPVLIARRVLAIAYTTMAPNFIVIGIDSRQSRMLFHQLERSSVSKMTKALGARPGVQRS